MYLFAVVFKVFPLFCFAISTAMEFVWSVYEVEAERQHLLLKHVFE